MNSIKEFLQSLAADGKSPCTIANYKGDLQGFNDWLKQQKKPLNSLRYSDLRNWANSLEGKGYTASTRSRKIAAVKSFFKYLLKMEVITQNPADGLTMPKAEKKQPKVISLDEAKNLLDELRWVQNSDLFFRDYAILATFLYTGVRREEITNIKLADVDLQKGQVLIHGKGAKQRFVFINPTLAAILSEYLAVYRELIHSAENSLYLFPSSKNEKLAVRTINNIVNKAFELAGIKEKGVSAHILRKRFATSIFQGTGDIATTSKMLGHSSPTVTMRYVVIDEQNMRNAANAVNF